MIIKDYRMSSLRGSKNMIPVERSLVTLGVNITSARLSIQLETNVDQELLQKYIVIPLKETSVISSYITLMNRNMGLISQEINEYEVGIE